MEPGAAGGVSPGAIIEARRRLDSSIVPGTRPRIRAELFSLRVISTNPATPATAMRITSMAVFFAVKDPIAAGMMIAGSGIL
jgi:hypothetical protein